MRTWSPRASKGKAGRDAPGEPVLDVFEQPERSILGDALSKPVGLVAALLIVVAMGVFLTNHFYWHMERINDFALVGFFVGGGVLLSMLLRSGDAPAAVPKATAKLPSAKRKKSRRSSEQKGELVLETTFEQPNEHAALGLAEAPAAGSPVPAAALIDPKAVKPASDPVDNEVASFQKALVHYVQTGDFHGQGEVLRRLGHLAKARGHLKESREFYMNARAAFRKIDDHYAEAAVLLDLGQVLESLDEHDAASAAYRDANRALLDVAMNSSDRYNAVQAHAAD
ncbi:MAG: tetratricopeptide repeat protein [Alphaproteobacteria bacterium]